MTLTETLAPLHTFLSNYDWTKPQDRKLSPIQQNSLKAAVDALQSGNIEVQPAEAMLLYKAGSYVMHRQKDTQAAATLLQAAYNAVQKDEKTKDKLKASGDYFRLTNNFAFALTNAPEKLTDDRAATILGYLRETAHGTGDRELNAFTRRIIGQMHFAQAAETPNFGDRYELVKKGITLCDQGVKDLSPANNLAEIARTYNRNAVESLKLAEATRTPATLRVLLASANTYARTASDLWSKTHNDDFPEYKGRTQETLADIAVANFRLDGAYANKRKAVHYLTNAMGYFEQSGNGAAAEKCRQKQEVLTKKPEHLRSV